MEFALIFTPFVILMQSDEIRSPILQPPVIECIPDLVNTPYHENGEDGETKHDMVVMRRRVKKRRNSKRLSIINGHLYDAEVR